MTYPPDITKDMEYNCILFNNDRGYEAVVELLDDTIEGMLRRMVVDLRNNNRKHAEIHHF